MSAFEVLVWLLRLAFLGLLYLFLAVLARGLLRDLRGATSRGARPAGAAATYLPLPPKAGEVYTVSPWNRT